MSENPFEALSGGFDMNSLLEQAQQMQTQLARAQADLAKQEVTGTAGAVTVTVTGLGELTGVSIAPGVFDGSDAESLTDLGDLVVAAFRDGKAQAEALTAQAMGPLAGGGFPGLG